VLAAGRPAAPDTPWPADAQEVGRIVDAWGVRGWIKVQPYSSDPQALVSAGRWFLKSAEAAGRLPSPASPPLPTSIEVNQVRPHGDMLVAKPVHSADRGSAEALRGARIFVARSAFPATPDDEYYWVDLIGLAVVNRQGVRLGRVAGLIDTGPQSVLQVRAEGPDEGGGECLIPFVSAYVDAVDLRQRCITVDWQLDF
jgi:16S rRNA processing protein RimM